MTWRRAGIALLDRPGGRRLLAFLAKAWTGARVEYDHGRWVRVLPDGFVVVDSHHFEYYADQLRETAGWIAKVEAAARDYWLHIYSPSKADTVVDVGAGSGIETRFWSQAAGRVFAIEAHPETFARLEASVRRNQLHNVTPIFSAVADRSGTAYIEDVLNDEANTISESGLAVPARTLDEICMEHGIEHIDFLKMNIEGAERLAIQGMNKSLAVTDRLCIACHDFRFQENQNPFYVTKDTVTDFLRERGFLVVTRDQDPRAYVRDHVHGQRSSDRVGMPQS